MNPVPARPPVPYQPRSCMPDPPVAASGGGRATETLSKLRLSLRMKRAIAGIFVACTVFYLPIGHYMCKQQSVEADYDPEDARLHAARAVCQHLAVICIILYYGTFYYDFGDLNLYLVNT